MQEVDQFWRHEWIVIRDVQHSDLKAIEDMWEVLPQPTLVRVLHDEDQVRPQEELFRDPTARRGAQSSALGLDACVLAVNFFRRGAAPLIA